jgi:hypothetical protein
LKPTLAHSPQYSYEEFIDHLKAMKTVRGWEETSRFGHVGAEQSNRAHIARVLEYFSDCYPTQTEAIHKAEVFLMICDYFGRHSPTFATQELAETLDESRLSVEPSLLRAVHHIFTSVDQPADVDPKKVLSLALAFKEFEVSSSKKQESQQ